MLVSPELNKWSNKEYWTISGVGKEGEINGIEREELLELADEIVRLLDKKQLFEIATVVTNEMNRGAA